MAITAKTRKRLWGLSGNRCAICKKELFARDECSEDSFNIGDECHIISAKPNGPRHVSGLFDYDEYNNLILLCKNHHKEIDTLTASYPEELLRFMKANHENWVKQKLDETTEASQSEEPRFLRRVTSGKDLLNILCGAHGYRIDYDEPDTNEEHVYIGSVIQAITDYGEIAGMLNLEQGQKVEFSIELKQILDELWQHGYLVFAEREKELIGGSSDGDAKWDIVTLLIKYCGISNNIES